MENVGTLVTPSAGLKCSVVGYCVSWFWFVGFKVQVGWTVGVKDSGKCIWVFVGYIVSWINCVGFKVHVGVLLGDRLVKWIGGFSWKIVGKLVSPNWVGFLVQVGYFDGGA